MFPGHVGSWRKGIQDGARLLTLGAAPYIGGAFDACWRHDNRSARPAVQRGLRIAYALRDAVTSLYNSALRCEILQSVITDLVAKLREVQLPRANDGDQAGTIVPGGI
jgi:hypothetical protein